MITLPSRCYEKNFPIHHPWLGQILIGWLSWRDKLEFVRNSSIACPSLIPLQGRIHPETEEFKLSLLMLRTFASKSHRHQISVRSPIVFAHVNSKALARRNIHHTMLTANTFGHYPHQTIRERCPKLSLGAAGTCEHSSHSHPIASLGEIQANADHWHRLELTVLEKLNVSRCVSSPGRGSVVSHSAAIFPDSAHLSNVGQSAEGRSMIALTISSGGYVNKKKGGGSKQKKKKKVRPPLQEGEKLGVVIIGAQHAREVQSIKPLLSKICLIARLKWIATSTSLYLAHALVTYTSEPNSLRRLLDHFVRLDLSRDVLFHPPELCCRISTLFRFQTRMGTSTLGKLIDIGIKIVKSWDLIRDA